MRKTVQNNGFRPQTTQYRWNVADELISVKLDNGDCWHYEYDVFGRRIRKYRGLQHSTKEHSAKAHTEIQYQWQGDQLSQQQRFYADGSLATTQWLYEPDTFRPLAQARQFQPAARDSHRTKDTHDIELHFAITDIGGNVRELCTPEGEIEWRGEAGLWQDFLQWRKPQKQRQYLEEAANEPLYCDLRFQGQLYDKETGLYYNRHRYYDPEICQYISPDPIGMQGGLLPQAYVHNPLEWVDPFGLCECRVGYDNSVQQHRNVTNSGTQALQVLPEFSNRRKAFEHYAKHSKGVVLGKNGKMTVKPGGADVPEFTSFDEYVSAARSFWSPFARNGILQGTRADGAILRFEPSTGYFGVMKNGKISTFFRPDGDGFKYFKDQL